MKREGKGGGGVAEREMLRNLERDADHTQRAKGKVKDWMSDEQRERVALSICMCPNVCVWHRGGGASSGMLWWYCFCDRDQWLTECALFAVGLLSQANKIRNSRCLQWHAVHSGMLGFLCSPAQIMEPSIPSLDPINRAMHCDWWESNFKAILNKRKREKKRKNLTCFFFSFHKYGLRFDSLTQRAVFRVVWGATPL